MMTILWLLLFGIAAAFGWLIWHNAGKWQARRRAEEERFARFMAGSTGAAPPNAHAPSSMPTIAAADELPLQKLLYEAAHKAAEAGEPALAIQLYSRLLARYPASALAREARAAVAAMRARQKK